LRGGGVAGCGRELGVDRRMVREAGWGGQARGSREGGAGARRRERELNRAIARLAKPAIRER
jgi:hypothetical protein